ncbi:MAG: hypothetical protein J6039_02505 [Alphaproteobacteria bacterium]|nr:hypothetical protein [Alphaproteobacteria bacterium]
MNCNLKNRIIVMVACAFVAMTALTDKCHAAKADVSANQPVVADETNARANDDLLGLEAVPEQKKDTDSAKEKASEVSLDFLNEEEPKEPVAKVAADQQKPLLDIQPAVEQNASPEFDDEEDEPATVASNEEPIIPDTEAPRAPFENFGNAILSKVDSDLFNQMSNIEKQTALLKLELRREELRNKVEALKAARVRAQYEETDRQKAANEKMKNEAAEREAMMISQQIQLKEKEIELQKVKQAKILNDYMNEMLLTNQSWVEKNAKLFARVKELEEERTALINNSKEKIKSIKTAIDEMQAKADTAASVYKRNIDNLNSQISQMKDSMLESEGVIKQMREGTNPFGDVPSKDAIDMSEEYAIMDITGKGDDVVAKIVSRDGTTFTVHKGSMLKNGEVVTAITEHYISFENNGVQSYLYTGGTIREYEPTVSFNNASKTNWESSSESSEETVKKSSEPISFGKGMFVQ